MLEWPRPRTALDPRAVHTSSALPQHKREAAAAKCNAHSLVEADYDRRELFMSGREHRLRVLAVEECGVGRRAQAVAVGEVIRA